MSVVITSMISAELFKLPIVCILSPIIEIVFHSPIDTMYINIFLAKNITAFGLSRLHTTNQCFSLIDNILLFRFTAEVGESRFFKCIDQWSVGCIGVLRRFNS